MDNNTPLSNNQKSHELKKQLLNCLDREARHFSEIARGYFDKEQLSVEDKTGLLRAIVETIDHVMETGDWESSLFLRNTLKPLMQIKSDAELELRKLLDIAEETRYTAQVPAEDEQEVYISLFQSDGYNMGKWAMQLRSLERYVVGRPIYAVETDVQKRLSLRAEAAMNEAYAVVIVKKSDMQMGQRQDQFGLRLAVLKDTALKNGRIIGFVYQGMRYYFVDGQLVK